MIIFVLGVLIGSVCTCLIFRRLWVGTLRVNTSDPTSAPYLFLELSTGVDHVLSKNCIVLKVDAEGYAPHK